MERSRINPISKKKCKQNMIEISNRSHSIEMCNMECSKCGKPIYMNLKFRKPINQVSKKKRKELENEKPVREALWKRCRGCCEQCGCLAENSLGGLHPHEEVFRSRGGKLSELNSKMLCHVCHSKAHGITVVEY